MPRKTQAERPRKSALMHRAPAPLQTRLTQAHQSAADIGPMLREVRLELAARAPEIYGLRAVARTLALSPSTVSRYEGNTRRVPFSYIQAFSALIGTTVDGLIRLARNARERARYLPPALGAKAAA